MQTIVRYGTRDLGKAKTFYDGIAAVLGARCVTETPKVLGYRGSQGGMFLVGLPFAGEATAGNGTQVSFSASSKEMVDAVHARALELGGSDEGAPGPRGPEGYSFYACYFRDLDGNKLSAIAMPQQPGT